MLQNYLVTVTAFALLGSGCVVCFVLFLGLKGEISRLRAQLSQQDLRGKVDELNERMESAEEHSAIPAQVALRPGININKRAQVLRLSRLGQRPESIAASLSVPRRQVDLMLKMHAIALEGAGKTTS